MFGNYSRNAADNQNESGHFLDNSWLARHSFQITFPWREASRDGIFAGDGQHDATAIAAEKRLRVVIGFAERIQPVGPNHVRRPLPMADAILDTRQSYAGHSQLIVDSDLRKVYEAYDPRLAGFMALAVKVFAENELS
jgi:hypothetical protein